MTEVIKGDPPHRIEFRVWDTSGGIVGCLTGGDAPHVGGVVLSVPRASLTGEGISCDSWLTPIPGHKDLDVAVPIAEAICKAAGVPVSLTAGIHIDHATNADIGIISVNCAAAGDEMLRLISSKINNQEVE